ncbi:MAG: hypothetical protein ACO3VI_04455 [Ilumatobacteraceae bacterium]
MKRSIPVLLAVITFGTTACSGGDAVTETTAVSETTIVPATAATTETIAVTQTTAATETIAAPETIAVTQTTATPETTAAPATTVAPETTVAGGEVISDELELLTITSIGLGAGSGEYKILIAERPEQLERFKVSTAGSDGFCNARILSTQIVPDGVVVTVLPGDCGGGTFGVAWVHTDGRRSGITYRTCSTGITYETAC